MFTFECTSTKISGNLQKFDLGTESSYFKFDRQFEANIIQMPPGLLNTMRMMDLTNMRDAYVVCDRNPRGRSEIKTGEGTTVKLDALTEKETVIKYGSVICRGVLKKFDPGSETSYFMFSGGIELMFPRMSEGMLRTLSTIGLENIMKATIDFNTQKIEVREQPSGALPQPHRKAKPQPNIKQVDPPKEEKSQPKPAKKNEADDKESTEFSVLDSSNTPSNVKEI